MSEAADNDQTQDPAPDDGVPSSAPPSDPEPTTSSGADAQASTSRGGSLKGAGLRYGEGDGVPEWAVGKTADEILKMTQSLYQSVLDGSQPSQPQSSPQDSPNDAQTYGQTPQSPQTPANAQTPPGPPDPDLIYSNKAEYQRQLDAYVRAQNQSSVQAASAPILKPLARMARSQSQSDPKYADIWKRYGPEIEATIQQNVPEQRRTDPEIWNQAAKMVAGEHWEELAQDRAETVAATPPDSGTVSGGGVTQAGDSGGIPVNPIERLFREDHPSIQKFKRLGKDASDIMRHAQSLGHSPDDYAEILKNRASISWSASGTPTNEREAAHAAAVPAQNAGA